MTPVFRSEWRREFGLPDTGGERFVGSIADLRTETTDSQGHVLRRAFDLLELDGALRSETAPLVYFKLVPRIETAGALEMHHRFWNHGGAPILVLISPDEVQVHSGLVRPVARVSENRAVPSLVQQIDRASEALLEFLPAVESGEFFRRNDRFFNPAHRVDRDLLDNLQVTRQALLAAGKGMLRPDVLDALLCRLVFACYLFDREVIGATYLNGIGLSGMSHLRDILRVSPRAQAKKHLYELFKKLGEDFNGDLFSDNLDAEARQVAAAYIGPIDDFFRATDVDTGQASFWPYDFSAIPVEAISAIYEKFLKTDDRKQGAVYTPRFLAELVLDVALDGVPSLLERRFLDPAAGSGIFLVGIFNRIAEEWIRRNPNAPNDHRASQLRRLLCSHLCGIDISPTACRITAFSLYLAYLDHLSPRDIRELQQTGHKLPRLVHYSSSSSDDIEGNIWCGDFFTENAGYPTNVDLVVGNPPWGSSASDQSSAARWCRTRDKPRPIPDKQLSAAFLWKAPSHIAANGKICLVLPHGTLFNHSDAAVEFQRSLFTNYRVDHVLNLVDYQSFLFEEARHPAIVLQYRRTEPVDESQIVQYWAPKSDWLVTRADVVSILPEDRSTVTLKEILADLDGEDAPQIWKLRFWATPRDRRLIDRLGLYRRLRDYVRQSKELSPRKPWLIGEGFQPLGARDDKRKAKDARLPSRLFIEATSPRISLFILPGDCSRLPSERVTLRRAPNTALFKAPHVLVAKGFSSIAFADFDVSFQHALRGISGPVEDRSLLIFLAAYLRSPLAKYFVFQTSTNWGVSRQEVHVEELLRLPFIFPRDHHDPKRAREIVSEAAQLVATAARDATGVIADRGDLVRNTDRLIEDLTYEYFDIAEAERVLIRDTTRITIPSVRPSRVTDAVPTLQPVSDRQRQAYAQRLASTLNGWARNSPYMVRADSIASATLGIGLAMLQKVRRSAVHSDAPIDHDILHALNVIRHGATRRLSIVDLPRVTKLFDKDRLYLLKPIGQRFWTESAALNDADEIASSILTARPLE